jgi:hypothetical protein
MPTSAPINPLPPHGGIIGDGAHDVLPSHPCPKIVYFDRKRTNFLVKNAHFVVFTKFSKKVWQNFNIYGILSSGFVESAGRVGQNARTSLPHHKENLKLKLEVM